MGKTTHAEIAKAGGICRISDHKRGKDNKKVQKFDQRGKSSGSRTGGCGYCGKEAHERKDCPAREAECRKCKKTGHWSAKCRQNMAKDGSKVNEVNEAKEDAETVSVNTVSEDFFGEVAEVNELSMAGLGSPMPTGFEPTCKPTRHCGGALQLSPLMVAGVTDSKGVQSVAHHHCDRLGRWRRGQVEPHGRVKVRLEVCSDAYGQVGATPPSCARSTTASGLADTGAQMCLAGRNVMSRMGLSEDDLLEPMVRVAVANDVMLPLLGVAFVTMTGNGGAQSGQMLYFADGVTDMFVSKAALRDLGAIPEDFRTVHGGGRGMVAGSGRRRSSSAPPPLTVSDMGQSSGILGSPMGDTGTGVGVVVSEANSNLSCGPDDVFDAGAGVCAAGSKARVDSRGRRLAPCGCLERTLPPAAAEEPPFAATPGNVPRLMNWLKEQYASSTFNTCEHQPLPKMSGLPPLRIHVKDNVTPTAIHKPSTIPAHWTEQVKSETHNWVSWKEYLRTPQQHGAHKCI